LQPFFGEVVFHAFEGGLSLVPGLTQVVEHLVVVLYLHFVVVFEVELLGVFDAFVCMGQFHVDHVQLLQIGLFGLLEGLPV